MRGVRIAVFRGVRKRVARPASLGSLLPASRRDGRLGRSPHQSWDRVRYSCPTSLQASPLRTRLHYRDTPRAPSTAAIPDPRHAYSGALPIAHSSKPDARTPKPRKVRQILHAPSMCPPPASARSQPRRLARTPVYYLLDAPHADRRARTGADQIVSLLIYPGLRRRPPGHREAACAGVMCWTEGPGCRVIERMGASSAIAKREQRAGHPGSTASSPYVSELLPRRRVTAAELMVCASSSSDELYSSAANVRCGKNTMRDQRSTRVR